MKSLYELLKKEQKLLEDYELTEFDFNDCDMEEAGVELSEIKDKLSKVRVKILKSLEDEISKRKLWKN